MAPSRGRLCPQVYAAIKERKKLACMLYPTFNGDGQFEVREGNYRLAYENSINPLKDASQWPDSFGPQLRQPTIEKPKSGPRQKKRRLEAGELTTKKDRKGNAYKTVRRIGEKQKFSECNKIGHNKRAHGLAEVCLLFVFFHAYVHSTWTQW
ncbi:hypothetical protein LINPERHAP2_LOCUS27390 [Linum perenne]